MKIIGQTKGPVKNPKYVKKSENLKHNHVYEMRADKGKARLMFFYSHGEAIVVCTNSFWKKGKSNTGQDAAFGLCNEMKTLYETYAGRRMKNEWGSK